MPSYNGLTVAELIYEANSGTTENRVLALESLALAGPEAIPYLEGLISSKEINSQPASTFLSDIFREFFNVRDEKPTLWQLKITALQVLGDMGPAASGSVDFLVQRLLQNPSMSTAERTMITLSEIGADSTQAEKLIPFLQDSSSVMSHYAQEILAKTDVKIVPPLMKQLTADSTKMRAATASTLGRHGADAAEALTLLTELLRDEDPHVRESAQSALEEIRADLEAQATGPTTRAIKREAQQWPSL